MVIKLYRVASGLNEDLTPDEQNEKLGESFQPTYIHLHNDSTGQYVVAVIEPEVDSDYTLMEKDDPEYDELQEVVGDMDLNDMFDNTVSGSIH
jgi:hypothetical protein